MKTDEELFDLCRARDPHAWETLVRRYQDQVLGLSYQFCGQRDQARDLAQEIFIRLYQTMDQFQSGRSFRAWLLTLARNLCVDHYRRTRKERLRSERPLEEHRNLAANDEAPDSRLARLEREKALFHALDTLSATSREAIVMKELQNHSVEEMAELLGLPEGTVKSRLWRARLELARAILMLERRRGARVVSDAL